VPHPLNRPTGCPFHPRCEVAIAGTCDTRTPELLPIGSGPIQALVSCFQHHPVDGSGSREAN
jgi:ABC-type dipeptide/oligopeptide/nickel transport system ATPase component